MSSWFMDVGVCERIYLGINILAVHFCQQLFLSMPLHHENNYNFRLSIVFETTFFALSDVYEIDIIQHELEVTIKTVYKTLLVCGVSCVQPPAYDAAVY